MTFKLLSIQWTDIYPTLQFLCATTQCWYCSLLNVNEHCKRIAKMNHRLWWNCQWVGLSKLMGDARTLLQTAGG
jgi:hypothetical protein